MNWSEILMAAGGSGVLVQFFNYIRNVKRDAAKDKLAAAKVKVVETKNSADANLNFYAQLMEEQRDWRMTLRKEITDLQRQLGALQQENAELVRQVALLGAQNSDLQQENNELEIRVKELERELRQQHAAEPKEAA